MTNARCLIAAAALSCALAGCATLPPNAKPAPQDPWERANRTVYKFNDVLDRKVAKPVARTYVRFIPSPIRTGVSNFFVNLNMTTVMVNDALQGKFGAAANDLGRFLLNSTVGVAGLLDPATPAGLAKNDEDFGQTLGKWGVHPGPFIELPFFGPSDLRDAPARVVNTYTTALPYIAYAPLEWGLYGLQIIDTRASLLSLDSALQGVYDPYAFIRDAYLQRRAYLVSDGKVAPDDEPLVDPDPDADKAETGAPNPAPAPPPTP